MILLYLLVRRCEERLHPELVEGSVTTKQSLFKLRGIKRPRSTKSSRIDACRICFARPGRGPWGFAALWFGFGLHPPIFLVIPAPFVIPAKAGTHLLPCAADALVCPVVGRVLLRTRHSSTLTTWRVRGGPAYIDLFCRVELSQSRHQKSNCVVTSVYYIVAEG